jgi:uncharacterized membrane protein
MGYGLLLNLHLVAMVVWIVAMGLATLRLGRGLSPEGARRVLRAVATPAMLLTWVFGLWLAVQGGWFSQGWLHVKLVFVLALSALHGVALGRLRRIGPGGEVPGFLRALPWIILLLAAGAIWLALQKPF